TPPAFLAGEGGASPAALVTGPSAPAVLTGLRRLTREPALRARLSERSLETAERTFAVTTAVDHLLAAYARAQGRTLDLRDGDPPVPLPRTAHLPAPEADLPL